MAKVAGAHLFSIILGLAGLAMLASGLAGESRNGVRIVLSVLLLATALIVSGLQVLLGSPSGSSGGHEGEGH